MKISELKKEAKVKLSGCYKLVLGIYLISSLIISIVSLITSRVTGFLSFILSILGIIVTFAFGYGIADSNLKLSRNVSVGITDFITVGFKNFKRTFFLFLTLFVKLLIPIILLTVASVLPIVANFVYDAESSGYTLLSLGGSLLTILALIYFLYKVMSFVLAIYILVDNQEMKGKEAVIKSAELMKGNKTNFIKSWIR